MISRPVVNFIFLTVFFFAFSACEKSPTISPSLENYITYNKSGIFSAGVSAAKLDEKNCTTPYRDININGRTELISVIEGYRVMYSYPGRSYFFANMKVEKSAPESYLSDKEKITEYFNSLSNEQIKVIEEEYNGHHSLSLDSKELDRGGVISMQVIFFDADNIIVTIYFLNQGKENRVFNSIDEYMNAKKKFLQEYADFVKLESRENRT